MKSQKFETFKYENVETPVAGETTCPTQQSWGRRGEDEEMDGV
jgi:hypothetical protein